MFSILPRRDLFLLNSISDCSCCLFQQWKLSNTLLCHKIFSVTGMLPKNLITSLTKQFFFVSYFKNLPKIFFFVFCATLKYKRGILRNFFVSWNVWVIFPLHDIINIWRFINLFRGFTCCSVFVNGVDFL